MSILWMILAVLKAFFTRRANLAAENVMLRQQLIVQQRSVRRLKLPRTDRILLCWLSRLRFHIHSIRSPNWARRQGSAIIFSWAIL